MNQGNVRIVFMGTSEYAVPILQALVDAGYTIPLVITQPDRPKGRRRKIAPPPLKLLAEQLQLPVFQPEKLICRESCEKLEGIAPDVMITASYGQILRQKHLNIPTNGILNVHASLLPELRGAAPVQYAIIRGYTRTGVTIMQTETGIDTGPIVAQSETPIWPEDTAGSLEKRLASLGAKLLVDTLPRYLSGEIKPIPQDHTSVTHAPMLTTEDGRINWDWSAKEIVYRIQGTNPHPGAFTTCRNNRLKLYTASITDKPNHTDPPGTILDVVNGKGILVQTGDGLLILHDVQPACRKRMIADCLVRGRFVSTETVLGAEIDGESEPCPE